MNRLGETIPQLMYPPRDLVKRQLSRSLWAYSLNSIQEPVRLSVAGTVWWTSRNAARKVFDE